MAGNGKTTVWLDRDAALDLRSIATDLSRQWCRQVPLGEVVRRLIEMWRGRGGQ
jgi:hypothetical protein